MYKRRRHGWLKYRDFIILDLLTLQIAFYLSYMVRFGVGIPYTDYMYRNISIVMMFIDLFVLIFFDSFGNVLHRGYYEGFKMTIKHVFLVVMLFTFYLFSVQSGTEYSRIFILTFGINYLVLNYTVRVIWKRFLRSKVHNNDKRSLLIVTVAEIMSEVIENVLDNNLENYYLAGMVTMNRNLIGQEVEGIKIVANASTVTEYVCREWVDEVVISIPSVEPFPDKLINDLIDMGITVHLELAKSAKLDGKKQFVEKVGNYTVLTTTINTATSRELFIKRLVDILAGLSGCVIATLLFIILGPVIYFSSP